MTGAPPGRPRWRLNYRARKSALTWDVTGGTGQFADAAGSVTGTVSGRALLGRNPDGSCSLTQQPRLEVDKFAESGTLSF
jgi:hypothetical protein